MDFIIIAGLGKAFYDLAGTFEKNQWLYAILGIVTFYVASFFITIILVLLWGVDGGFSDSNATILSYGAIILSLILSLILYIILKNRWEYAKILRNREILDDNLTS